MEASSGQKWLNAPVSPDDRSGDDRNGDDRKGDDRKGDDEEQQQRDESEAERLDRNYGELLQELRVLQAGVQILFAFLLTIAFQQRFAAVNDFQRNVYLVGHRLGWPGTGSHRIFYDLDKLATGDRIVLRDSRGHSFEYRVTDSLLVGPEDSWVKDVVPGRDMVSLQTCTPIPSFEKRLVVRADRT